MCLKEKKPDENKHRYHKSKFATLQMFIVDSSFTQTCKDYNYSVSFMFKINFRIQSTCHFSTVSVLMRLNYNSFKEMSVCQFVK